MSTVKIVSNFTRFDPGLSGVHIEFLMRMLTQLYPQPPATVITVSLSLPHGMWGLPCYLYGPTLGDPAVPDSAVTMAPWGGRSFPSRVVPAVLSQCWRWPKRLVRQLTVIAGPYGRDPFVVWRAYGGPPCPPEPHDPDRGFDDSTEAIAFWSTHALAVKE
jgi:hypothetical protein